MSKFWRQLMPLAFSSLILVPGLAGADEAPVTLNLLPPPQVHQVQDLRVKMVMDMKLTPREGASEEELQQLTQKMGAVKMPLIVAMQMRQRLQTGAQDAQRRIPMTARIEASSMEMRTGNGDLVPGVPNRGMPEMEFSADIVNGRYENIRLSGEGMPSMSPKMMENMFRKTFDSLAQLNGAQLRLGETVETPLEMNLPLPNVPAGTMGGKVMARYTLTKLEAGVAFFDVSATLDFKMDLPMPAAASAAASAASAAEVAPQTLKMVMSGSGTGHLQLRLADRLQVHNDLDMHIDMHMPLPQGHAMGMAMQVSLRAEGQSLPVAKGKASAAKAVPAKSRKAAG